MFFDLDYMALALTAPDICPIFKIPLIYFGTNENSRPRPDMASIDRIDNTKGYTMDNVIIISFKANAIKSNASVDEMVAVSTFYKNLSLQKSALQDSKICTVYAWLASCGTYHRDLLT